MAQKQQDMANIHAARRRRKHLSAITHHALLILLRLRQSEPELEAHRGQIHHPHRRLARRFHALPVREELARGQQRPLGVELFRKGCGAAIAVQWGGQLFELV